MPRPNHHAASFAQVKQGVSGSAGHTVIAANVGGQAARQGLLSDEHFTVDGTLLEAWMFMAGYRIRCEVARA
jgi:hypothetical protein